MDRPLAADVDLARIGAYRGLTELEAAFEALPGVRARALGTTSEGRPIRAYELGEPGAPSVGLVMAGLHAMEWIGVEVSVSLATTFCAARPAGRRLVVLPVLNPDGFARVERDLRAGRRSYVRANARGVDLNRNFPTHFRAWHLRRLLLPILGGPGPSPGSEAETRAVLDVLDREKGRLDRAVSLHSFGRKVLLPYGGRWALPPDLARVEPLARDVGRRLGYDVRVTSRWLPGMGACGLELDHLHASGVTALLVECSAGGLSLRDPSSWLHPFRWYNPPDPAAQASAIAEALSGFVAPERAAERAPIAAEVHA